MHSYLTHATLYSSDQSSSPPYTSPKPQQQPPQTISEVFKKIIAEYEVKKPQNINAIQISKMYKIQHRRVYDLFNFITSFGVCRIIERKKVGWVGLDQFNITLTKSYEEMEKKSLTTSFKDLFDLGPSPSLGTIGTKFLCLFIYMGTDSLSMRNVSALFHDPSCDIKSLERRIYLVLSFLEIIGAISKGSNRGEYVIKLDVKNISHQGLKAREKESIKLRPTSIDSLIAKDGLAYRHSLFHSRRLEFQGIISA